MLMNLKICAKMEDRTNNRNRDIVKMNCEGWEICADNIETDLIKNLLRNICLKKFT